MYAQNKIILITDINNNWAMTKTNQPYPANPFPPDTDWLINKSTGLLNSGWTFDVKYGALAGSQTSIVSDVGYNARPIWVYENLCEFTEPINEPSTYNFRNTFFLDDCIKITYAKVRYTTDNSCRIYINGKQLVSQNGFYNYEGSAISCDETCGDFNFVNAVNPPATKFNSRGFNEVEVADITSFLEPGINVIAIENLNSGGCGVNFGWICTNLEINYGPTDMNALVNAVTNKNCESEGSFSVSATGGVAPYTYVLNGTSQNNGTFLNVPPGLHTVYITDKMGCERSVEVLVENEAIIPELIIDQLDNLKDCGDTEAFLKVSVQNGGNNVQFSFDNGPFNSNTFYDNLSTGTHTLIAKNEFGCTSNYNFEVIGNSEFVLKFIDEVICYGESINILGQTYSNSGSYTDTIPSPDQCDTLYNIELEVRDLNQTNMEVELCFGEELILGNQTYQTSGVYQQMHLTPQGCDSIINIDLNILDFKEGEIDVELCEGEVINIGEESYSTTGDFTQILNSTSGCDSTLSIRIGLKDEELCENGVCGRFFIPNVFTPNFDNVNDYFEINRKNVTINEMIIFNRWGGVLFSSHDENPKWDGNIKDQEAQTGVYVYLIRGYCNNNIPFFKYGDVTLIR